MLTYAKWGNVSGLIHNLLLVPVLSSFTMDKLLIAASHALRLTRHGIQSLRALAVAVNRRLVYGLPDFTHWIKRQRLWAGMHKRLYLG